MGAIRALLDGLAGLNPASGLMQRLCQEIVALQADVERLQRRCEDLEEAREYEAVRRRDAQDELYRHLQAAGKIA